MTRVISKPKPKIEFGFWCISFFSNAGLKLTGDEQCAFLMRDNEARIDHDENDMDKICYSMRCKSPNKRGFYSRAGPALEGTRCSLSDERMVRYFKNFWIVL